MYVGGYFMTINLSKEHLEIITKTVLDTVTVENKKAEKEKKDFRLRNTKLLLKNYHILKEHCTEIEEELIIYDPIKFDSEEIKIESIMLSKEKTRKMIIYMDAMIDAYERYSKKAGEAASRRYKALYHFYISDYKLTYIELSEQLDVHERTVRKDIEEARNELSIFLFGILSIEDTLDDMGRA